MHVNYLIAFNEVFGTINYSVYAESYDAPCKVAEFNVQVSKCEEDFRLWPFGVASGRFRFNGFLLSSIDIC